MSTPINDGGPAFPFGQVSEATGQPINGFFNPGMSLRDWFAGQALASSFFEVLKLMPAKVSPKQFAESLYGMADAMLEARNQKGVA